ncbi:MAG TPA: BON domain-containing protein [Steroidobacteraceae bacterium]|nr:BON domain-containing protein [Steroidobacteraceae bacterium]
MRSEQDRRTSTGRRRPHSPRGGDERSGDERFEGQYEKDAWRPDGRADPPHRSRDESRGQSAAGTDERRYERRPDEPYDPAREHEPFEPGPPREGGAPFGTGQPPRYLGTGYPGRGGPGFTGGFYGFGAGSLEPDWRAGRRYPPGPKGYQRSDERLREDISERLMQARYIDSSDVTVEVAGAKVVLAGTVPERRMKHAIEDLVDACPGVQDIDNRIRVGR